MNLETALSLKELVTHIKSYLESGFKDVVVKGEAIGVSRHISGHLYFFLKEENITLDCIVWKYTKLNFEPKEGSQIICTGSITTYPNKSKYQLIIKEVKCCGIGELLKLIEDRRIKLQAEGLFDSSRKKPLPKFPRMIGIITSPTGAVIHDMLHRITERYPCKILVYPINVQGEKMPSDAIRAIKRMQKTNVDLIILARGGGSFDDLFGFNDEPLVRTVANCAKPIISAIGHETDFTLCDHAASLRAPTPTAAIELCTPDKKNLQISIVELENRILHTLKSLLDNAARLIQISESYHPNRLLSDTYQRLDYAHSSLISAISSCLENKKSTLERLIVHPPNIARYSDAIEQNAGLIHSLTQNQIEKIGIRFNLSLATLGAMSPRQTLKRGFCRAYSGAGVIDTVQKAKKARVFNLEFANGIAEVILKEKVI